MQPSFDSSPRNTPSSSPEPDSQAVRRVLDGRYQLRRLLAVGGGAEVFAAEHCYTKRSVAVKLPLETTFLQDARVRREVEALTRVSGGGVVEMVDAAEIDGRPYIVFELLEGRTLAGLLAARGKLSIEDVLKVGLELTATLSRCHAVGVVHRDVKPSNVFVTLQPKRQVVLLDFGIAKLSGADAPREKLTRESSLLGTPEYMAPESLLSSPDADHRVDVYGVGVVLYECLTGAVPFDGNYADVLSKVSLNAPRSAAELRSDVPADLVRVVMKCLNRAVEDRYATMEALHSALRACASRAVAEVRLLAGLANVAAPAIKDADTLADAPASRRAPDWTSRRKHPRVPYTTLARIKLDGGGRVDGRIEEISEGGLQFVGEQAVAATEVVRIRFALPTTGRIVEVVGVSRWNRTVRGTNATGFQFQALAAEVRDEICRYVALMGAAVA